MSKKQKDEATKEAAEKAEKIAAEGEDVQERTRKAFVEAFGNRPSLDGVSHLAGEMMDAAVSGVKEVAPKDRESVLRKVIDGLADGMSSTANAAKYALEEARGRGERFAKEDVEKLTDNLRTIEETFVDTIATTISRAGEEISGQVRELSEHTKRAASGARPAIDSALHAALNHPVQLTGEAVTTGMKAVPKAAGMLLQAVSGALQGAGEMLAGPGEEAKSQKTGTRKKSGSGKSE